MIELLGVDTQGQYRSALSLLGRLAFENASLHLAHFEPPIQTWVGPGFIASSDDLANALTQDHQLSEQLLEAAVDDACGYGFVSRASTAMTPVASGIMSLGDELNADVIAIGSRSSGPLAAAFLGSVGRALAIGGNKSFLIGRGDVKKSGSVSVLFATDHSRLSMRALDWFIDHKPKGVSDVHLITAYNIDNLTNQGYFSELYEQASEQGKTLREHLKSLSEEAVAKLRSHGFHADYSLVPGLINAGISHSMKVQKADLLVLAAQGHGFFERLVMGSVALHQVVAEPYPVLVIRP